jgi:DnaJ family protein C protein 25
MRLRLLFAGLVLLATLSCVLPAAEAAQPNLYCGMEDCHAVLGVPATATQSEIKRAYYKLSLSLHPDKNQSAEAVPLYQKISNAYEVLGDPESRAAYEDALAHPEEFLRNQYRYAKHTYRHAKQIDVLPILLALLIVSSILHWKYWIHRYHKVRTLIAAAPLVQQRMRAQVKENLTREKLAAGVKNPTVLPHEVDAAVKLEDVSKYAELTSWDGRLPTWKDALPVWLVLFPYRFLRLLWWWLRYTVLFTILKQPYGPEEREYATSQALGLAWEKYRTIQEAERAELVSQEFWIPGNLEKWQKERMRSKKKTW